MEVNFRYAIGTKAKRPKSVKASRTRGDAMSAKELIMPSCRPAYANTKLPGMIPSDVATA